MEDEIQGVRLEAGRLVQSVRGAIMRTVAEEIGKEGPEGGLMR